VERNQSRRGGATETRLEFRLLGGMKVRLHSEAGSIGNHMSDDVALPRKVSRTRALTGAGYTKGEATRLRILDAALLAFGEAGYATASTRQIAQTAGVSLPALQYYFSSKEGLYRACAEAIVSRVLSHTSHAASSAIKALDAGCPADAARRHLKKVVGALAGLLVGAEEAQQWAQFVAREMRDPGPAFEILYEKLWRPGVGTASRLIGRIVERPASDPKVRVQALLIITALLAFRSGRSISLRTMEWSSIGPNELALVMGALDVQIDALGRGRP
jgi:TetR/AcrR family transcriptional regulator, regulator of cefoperazone and chloramphenicol sensitivity